jgi:hypothetical protein
LHTFPISPKYATCPIHSILLVLSPYKVWWSVQIMQILIMLFSPSGCLFLRLWSRYSLSTLQSGTTKARFETHMKLQYNYSFFIYFIFKLLGIGKLEVSGLSGSTHSLNLIGS